MADLNTIMTAAPAVDDANGATTADVASGQTFWGLASGQWGVQTGTKPAPLAQFIVPPLVVPQTGQTTCYNDAGSVIACTDTGQDGEYRLGITPALAPTYGTSGAFNTPAWTGTRFTDNEDGTVTDNLTALVWLQDANCFSTRTWTTALSDANGLVDGACGLSDGSSAGDWRLPNTNELHSLIDLTQSGSPKLPSGHPFTTVQSDYWSSTSNNIGAVYAWYISLNDGLVYYHGKNFTRYVWPVRAGQ